jgi:SAM-dependent methyltransferase
VHRNSINLNQQEQKTALFHLNCRACGCSRKNLVLNLGLQPLANNLLPPENLGQPEPIFPLRLFVCPSCWMLQISDQIPPVQLFSDYLYFSSFSDAMLDHARKAATRYIQEYALGPEQLVVEIASNDGYLLRNFQRARVPCLGIEPAANIAAVARENGIETVVDFFGQPLAQQLRAAGKPADLILGNNVFAHAPDINDFIEGLRILLQPRGRVVLEFPYAVDLIEKNEFDTIYHEHVYYFTLTALQPLFAKHQLEIFQVEPIPIHGGSLRIFAGHANAFPAASSVTGLLEEESRKGVASLPFYHGFARHVREIKSSLVAFIHEAKQAGKSIAAYGASAKGSTLLNFCGLGRDSIDFVADRSTYKQGRLTPGAHLPIVPPGELLEKMPDYTLLLTWNFADEILEQQRAYRERGGKFIIPIPKVRLL